MHVEHLIPVDLKWNARKLSELKATLRLPSELEIESFENWRPAHSDCNLRKSGIPLDAPFVGIEFERGKDRAGKAAKLAKKIRADASLNRAVAKIASARFHDKIPLEKLEYLKDVVPEFNDFHESNRVPERRGDGIELGFGYLVSNGTLRVVKQPYGIGIGPAGPDIPRHMRCGICGNVYFNGIRCTLCGEIDDD